MGGLDDDGEGGFAPLTPQASYLKNNRQKCLDVVAGVTCRRLAGESSVEADLMRMTGLNGGIAVWLRGGVGGASPQAKRPPTSSLWGQGDWVTRVLVVGSVAAGLGGFLAALSGVPEIDIVAEVASVAAALDALRRFGPDVALIDVRASNVDGIGTVEALSSLPQNAPVAVAVGDSDGIGHAAIEAGATAVLREIEMPDRGWGARVPTEGDSFVAELPLKAAIEQAASSVPTDPGSRSARVRVLYAEDDNGKPVDDPNLPDGGCVGEANRALRGQDTGLAWPETANQIQQDSYDTSMADPRVGAVFEAWSSCMADKGFDYPTPVDANADPAWSSDTPSERELATAVADVDCKREVKLVETWSAVESEIQQQMIDEHVVELTAARTADKEALARAARVVAGGEL